MGSIISPREYLTLAKEVPGGLAYDPTGAKEIITEQVDQWRSESISRYLDDSDVRDLPTKEARTQEAERLWEIDRADAIKDCVSLLEETYEEMIKE
jgi:hypothetical protein